jgi:hypothetical protein
MVNASKSGGFTPVLVFSPLTPNERFGPILASSRFAEGLAQMNAVLKLFSANRWRLFAKRIATRKGSWK